jgi:outer membrane protein assembly factor BamB
LALLALTPLSSADWPAYMHDNLRSGVTQEQPKLPLKQVWVHKPAVPPQPAWTGPAKWDAYAGIKGLRSMRDFDPVYYVTAVGGEVYFGSSGEDAVHSLDAQTGTGRWSFFTDGPVRVPPSWQDGKLYFGSDDGCAYCLDARSGALVWKHKPSASDRLIPSNGKLISPWPVRTGVLVQDGKAYFAASLLPWEESYLCAVEAQTGGDSGERLYKVVCAEVTMQGAMLASESSLYVLQGRSAPLVYRRADGKLLGPVSGPAGGVYALLTKDAEFIHGHGSKTGWLSVAKEETRDHLAAMSGANRLVVSGATAYLQKADDLSALDHARYVSTLAQVRTLADRQTATRKQLDGLPKEKADERRKLEAELKRLQDESAKAQSATSECFRWTAKCPYQHALILAGETLFAGGDGRVAAFSAADGHEVWSAPVEGQAHGLAVANSRLFVSTDTGAIYCFAGT